MAGIRGFQQDPSGPPGMGMFDFEDGSSLYAHNPEAAAPFISRRNEVTPLNGEEEDQFREWARKSKLHDVDHPDSHYDYRGAWKEGMKAGPDAHWSDKFKQHGHPTFSEESQYSRGVGDGGTWDDNGNFVPSPLQMAEAQTDKRTASIGGALRNAVNIAGGPLATALVPRASDTGEVRRVEPSVADVGPNMSPAPVEAGYSQAPPQTASQAPQMSESTASAQAPQQPAQVAPSTPQARGGMPAISPFVRTAATPGGYRPQTQSVEQTGSAVPNVVLDAYLRSRNEGSDQEFEAKRNALMNIAAQEDAMRVHAAQQYEAQQKAMAAATAEHEEATRNIDSDFASSNATHRIGLALAQGLMTVGAIWNNRQPPNMDWVQHEIDRDVKLQNDAYQKEGLRAQNKLTDLMQKYQLSSEQAAGVLKNLQATKAALIGERYAVASGTPQIKSMWEAWKNDEMAKRRAETFAILRDAAGTAKTSTSSRYQQASAGGLAVNPNYRALLNLRKEEAGVAKAEHETGWAAGTVFPDEGTFQRSYLQAVQQNPELTPEQFKRANLEKGGSGGGRGAGLYGQFTNAEAVGDAATELRRINENYHWYDAVTHPIESARTRARAEKLGNMIIPAAARMVHGGSPSEKEIALEEKGIHGAWDPAGTQQERLRVIEEESKRRKEGYGRGLQMGFGAATEEDSEGHR